MITLKRYGMSETAIPGQFSWPMRLETLSTDLTKIPSEIFVFQSGAGDPELGDIFSCVASTHQLDELPTDAPIPSVPFYRKSSVLLDCRTLQEADDLYLKILADVTSLVANLKLRDNLPLLNTMEIS